MVDNVSIYETGEEFLLENFPSHFSNIVIIENKKPYTLTIESRERFLKAKFIILAANVYPEVVKENIMKGTLGYLTFDCSEEELFTAIDAVVIGKRYLSAPVMEAMLKTLLTKESIYPSLTRREMEVLEKVCKGKDQHQIALEMGLSIYTVQNFTKVLRKKMGVTRTVDLIVLAINDGFYLPG